MNFSSIEFFLFLSTLLVLYTLVFRRENLRTLLLLIASYAFYMSWSWKYAGLLLLSTVIDYLLGRWLASEDKQPVRKALLVASLTANLGLLAIFKYFNFFVDVTAQTLSVFGIGADLSFLHHRLLLPVGISFYTFQTLSYTIDVYRREIDAEKNFIKFALFVSFFPQLVAGPIVRARDFLPQLHKAPAVSDDRFQSGLALIFRGLFKKMVIADMLAGLGVDAVFANPSAYSSTTLLLALYGYAFQIYADFSGYSDIAIGVARMLGFDLAINFDRPYLAQNVREFWARWHISLSTWLRDYLYIPLGGNRSSSGRVKFNLLVTMLLGGLWHGAALNFIFWGLWHGLLLIFARGTARHNSAANVSNRVWNRLLTFHLVLFGWLLFRVEGWSQLAQYTNGMLDLTWGTELSPLFVAILALAVAMHYISREMIDRALDRFVLLPVPVQASGYAVLLLIFTGLAFGTPAFIYFQF